VKTQLSENDYYESKAEDYEKSQHSLEDWRIASTFTTEKLNKLCKEPKKLLFFVGAVYECHTTRKKKFRTHTQLEILLDIPVIEDLKSFRDIYVYVAPRCLKDFKYNPLKSKETYVNEGWQKRKIGTNQNTHALNHTKKGERKQYGLKHFVTSTLHVLQGLTIEGIATEINMFSNEYNLWDVAQLLVLLSRTRRAKDIIFVGDHDTTIQSILKLMTMTSQWTDYIENVIRLVGNAGIENENNVETNRIRIFNFESYPLEYRSIPIPRCNTGYVYFLVSVKDTSKTYIGQTMDLTKRINQHNSGYGTDFTNQIDLRPWVIYAFISGFERRRRLMMSVEKNWQARRQYEFSRGVRDPKELARAGEVVIPNNEHTSLCLLLCFKCC